MKNKGKQIDDSKNEGIVTMYRRPFVVTIILVMVLDFVFLFFMGVWAGKASAEPGRKMLPPPPPMVFGMMEGREHPGMIMELEHPMWRHISEVGLDEKQMRGIRLIQNRVMKEMIRKRADIQIAGIELKELFDEDSFNLKVVEMKLRRLETMKTEGHLILIKAMEEIKGKLTPDQRRKLKEILQRGPQIRERGRMDGMTEEHLGMLQPWEIQEYENMVHEMDLGCW